MTVRDANFADIPQIADLLVEAHGRSRYAGTDVQVDVREAKALLSRSIQRHGGERIGSTLVLVAQRDSFVTGVLVGVLDRFLGIETRMVASDLFFVCSPLVEPRDPERMLETFESWALQNPNVFEILLGAHDAVVDPERVARLYERRGFRRCGYLFKKEKP